MLACRTCRIPLNAQTGCALCNAVRQNLVAVDELDDKPSLSAVGGEVVADLKLALSGTRKKLKACVDARPRTDDEREKAEANEDRATNRLLAISNTLAKVLESARKLQTDGIQAVANMSFQDRAALFVEWFAGLPPAYRTSLQEQMAKFEESIAAPITKELP